jgi:hypothetical protein
MGKPILNKTSGIPIKNRGIRWKESYGDKSAYLKEQFEKQVGPGSYFRWEGHDSTSGEDYYVVVTPGYSKKRGFHFFAGLRKIPAENGSSGKKFNSQMEALSYAMETWRVPKPETKPHKAYVDKDLKGKPIVMENVHASTEPTIIRISSEDKTTTFIDASKIEKQAMTFEISGITGHRFQWKGKKEIARRCRTAAMMRLIMKKGAAWHVEIDDEALIDVDNQGRGKFLHQASGEELKHLMPFLATCQNPLEESFNSNVHEKGVSKIIRLCKTDRETGDVTFKDALNPTGPNVKKFSDACGIRTTVTFGRIKKPEFLAKIQGMANLTSRLPGIATQNIKILEIADPPEGKRGGNCSAQLEIPVDLFAQVKEALAGTATIKKMPFTSEDTVSIFNFLEKKGQLATPEGIAKMMNIPILERITTKGGQAIVYDEMGWPLGIRVRRIKDSGISDDNNEEDIEGEIADEELEDSGLELGSGELVTGKESFSEGGADEDVQYEFADGVIAPLLAKAGGDLTALREAFVRGRFQDGTPLELTSKMFIDSRTAAHLRCNVRSEIPRVDRMGIPQLVGGKVQYEFADLVPPHDVNAATFGEGENRKYRARTFDLATKKQVATDLPEGIERTQKFTGIPTITPNCKQYVLIQTPEGEKTHEIDVGEWKVHDVKSKGKFNPGLLYVPMSKIAERSPMKTDLKKQATGHERKGFFLGDKEIWGKMTCKKEGQKETRRAKRGVPKIAEVDKYVVVLRLKDGTLLEVPPRNAGPAAWENTRAAQEIKSGVNVIGYYTLSQRQHKESALITAKPPENGFIEQEQLEMRGGLLVPKVGPDGQPLPPLRIPAAKCIYAADATGKKTPTNFEDNSTPRDLLMARLEIGGNRPFTPVTTRHLWIMDDLYQAFLGKKESIKTGQPFGGRTWTEADLSPAERTLMKFKDKSEEIPEDLLVEIAGISPDNTDDFDDEEVTTYGIWALSGNAQVQAEDWASDAEFGTPYKADEFMQAMQRAEKYAGVQMEVRTKNEHVKLSGMTGPITTGLEYYRTPMGIPTEPEAAVPGEVPPEVPAEAVPEEVAPEAEEAVPSEVPLEETAPVAPVPAVSTQPGRDVPQMEPTLAPAAVAVEEPPPQPMRPVPPKRPLPDDDDEFVNANSAIERLVRLANRLDDQGRIAEADAVDRLINITLAKIKKEKGGYSVKSEKGKNLGGPYKSKEKAKERIRQVEYFKNKGK